MNMEKSFLYGNNVNEEKSPVRIDCKMSEEDGLLYGNNVNEEKSPVRIDCKMSEEDGLLKEKNVIVEKSEKGHRRYRYYKTLLIISLVLNILVVAALCSFVAQSIFRPTSCGRNDEGGSTDRVTPSPQSEDSLMPSSTEDSYYRCSPCELMGTGPGDIQYTEHDTSICCKQVNKRKYQVVNQGSLLEECKNSDSSTSTDNPAMLLYYDMEKPSCSCKENATEGTLRWTIVRDTPGYTEGGVKHDTCTGEVTVPSSGLYGVYSYIQFDAFTVDTRMSKVHEAVYHTIQNKGSGRILQLNRFMVDKDSYVYDQIGPIIVHLNAGDKLIVTTNLMKYIHRDPRPSTIFGLYKLR